MSAVETFPDKIAAALKPVVAAEARRIVDAKADSPEERAARREAQDINYACKAVAEAYDAATAKGVSARCRAGARSKLFAEAAKLRKIMLRYGRISPKEGE